MLDAGADVFVCGLLDEVSPTADVSLHVFMDFCVSESHKRVVACQILLVRISVIVRKTGGGVLIKKFVSTGCLCHVFCKALSVTSKFTRPPWWCDCASTSDKMFCDDAGYLPSSSQVAYILNIRGNDVAHSPVAIAYLLVTEKGATVFIDQAKMSTEVEAEMKVCGSGGEALASTRRPQNRRASSLPLQVSGAISPPTFSF